MLCISGFCNSRGYIMINRRRAPSSEISSEKKLSGHLREGQYAELIEGKTISGTGKGDVIDKNGNLHSVKSGKKWQVFLYSHNRISESRYLNIFKPCLEAFPENYEQYLADRERCIEYKEKYVQDYGRDAAKHLPNADVVKHISPNVYIESKERLARTTSMVCDALQDKDLLRNVLDEALFNLEEVAYLAIKDSTYNDDGLFKVFSQKDVLDTLSDRFHPAVSEAGRVPEDYNVAGQKTLLCYKKPNGRYKNIVEVEIRNDSNKHYRQVRFNMYSKDTLYLLLNRPQDIVNKEGLAMYGPAIKTLQL